MNAFGIDLGTNNIKIYNGITDSFFLEKNMIAIEGRDTLLAYGDSAFEMYEKAPDNITISYPLCNGVIADIGNMQTLLKYFMNDLFKGSVKPADYYIAVPTDITDVEKRAFYELIKDANIKAKNVYVVDKAVADSLMQCSGKLVKLHYVEYNGKLPWRGMQKHIVDGILSVEQSNQGTAIPIIDGE